MRARGRRGLVWFIFVVLASLVAGAGQVGGLDNALARFSAAAQEPDSKCQRPRYDTNSGPGGGWQGEAPGVSVVGQVGRSSITFAVAPGYRVTDICVDTQQGASAEAPAVPWNGPGTFTVSSSETILFVGFTSAEVPPPPVIPTVGCVSQVSATQYRAHFGYRNENGSTVNVAVGDRNNFIPGSQNRGQPEEFLTGTHASVFEVVFEGTVTWNLTGNSVSASGATNLCPAVLRVDKLVEPESDPGQFTVQYSSGLRATPAGTRLAATTGDDEVPAGQYIVSESAVPPTSLADYDSSVVCRTGGGSGDPPIAQGVGPSIPVTVFAGSHVVCVFHNVNKDEPDPPGPENVDLVITKVVSEPVVQLGETVSWSVTLMNKGPATATNVVVKDKLPEGVKYVSGSLEVPAGVTCAAAVCTIGSLAPGMSRTATFETIATQVGEQINLVNIESLDQKDVNPSDNAASAKLQVEGTPVETVTPLLECVDQLENGKRRAHFGYVNSGGSTDVIPKGPRNKFDPLPHDRGQPDQFLTGRQIDVFQVDFESGELTWTLEGRTVQATGTSRSCNATLRIDKTLDPANDPGRFNLEIDGSVAGSGANVGNQGTTGDVLVAALPAGSMHTVGERATPGTNSDDYDTTIVCRAGGGAGAEVGSSTNASLAVHVAPGDSVVCTIDNTRKGGVTPPTPTPPTPPGPEPPPPPPPIPPIPPVPPTPPTPPAPGQPDLAITKVANPQTITIGSTYTVTIRVTNNGGATATNVTVTELISLRTALLSVRPSQGSCSAAARSCNLGTLAPGASATITGVVRGRVVGARVNSVEVDAAETDPDLTDNVASALVHVVGPTVCGQLRLNRTSGLLGRRLTLLATARTLRGTRIWGLNVFLRGPGVRQVSGTTNTDGIASFRVTPPFPGLLLVAVPRSNRCQATVGVRGKISPPVSG